MRYMKQILQGVEHMHKKRIVHLDLKVRVKAQIITVKMMMILVVVVVVVLMLTIITKRKHALIIWNSFANYASCYIRRKSLYSLVFQTRLESRIPQRLNVVFNSDNGCLF